ncbi:MAG TPA: DUF1156 domain-containing protein [Anaerolineae bacterium]|nr:DUF1156 domain-containing protein [Anaerolineae bacterium]
MTRSRVLIEDWLPAQAIGVECMRERSTGQQPPDKRLHVWWARRPLTVSRAAVLASLLPADFDRSTFERLLGFYASAADVVQNQSLVDGARAGEGGRISNPHGPRAFSAAIREPDVQVAHQAMLATWGDLPTLIDPMSGGGSIPLEAVRLGLHVLANEYNPVACSVLEATLDYPFRFGTALARKAQEWGKRWRERFNARMQPFYEVQGAIPAYTYICARTVPCPDTGHPTPLIPDWHLLKEGGKVHLVAEPLIVNAATGWWTIRIREIGKGAGQLPRPPQPTYDNGKGLSLFTGAVIADDYIKAMAQQGQLGSVLYAVATKATTRLDFRPPEPADLQVLERAARELERVRPQWERDNIIPTEEYPAVSSDPRPRVYGMPRWADLFAPRQLLALGVLVEELRALRPEILREEGEELGEAVIHLLAFVIDKLINYNAQLSIWHPTRGTMANVFSKHDFSFKATFAEMPLCIAGGGLEWAIDSVLEAYEKLVALPRAPETHPITLTQGSATNLFDLDDGSVTAVVVDPPYADNVQYSELADFFYVWLKRTQGHRRPEWFSTYLCDHEQEAVVNLSRFRPDAKTSAAQARKEAHAFYQRLMSEVFAEARRVLRDDGVLTVMFTHKQQEAWADLFESLIAAGFTITATWPVQTESQHSLHQAQKNAAQSTVLLVARKRLSGAGVGEGERGRVGEGVRYFDAEFQAELRAAAQSAAARLHAEGLNAVDQLVGAFGPAMEVFSRYAEVRTDTGVRVQVAAAIQLAADAVADWRVAQLATRGLEGVDNESRFVLLCWDVLGAAEFRFNEAMLLGRSVGMDVNALSAVGLISKSGDQVQLLPAAERRRERAIANEAEQMSFLESQGRRKSQRKVHPQDEYFASAIDMCHALALRCAEAGGGQAGIGAARGMALQQGWTAESVCARMMEALVHAAPPAVRFPGKKGKQTAADAFPEFRAWHAMLKPLFGIEPPVWEEAVEAQAKLW